MGETKHSPTDKMSQFSNGEFVYDPGHDWTALRSGTVFLQNDVWRVWFAARLPEERDSPHIEMPIAEYQGRIASHVLINTICGRGLQIDPSPWFLIRDHAMDILRDAHGRRLLLDDLLEKLAAVDAIEKSLIEDTLKMMGCMGLTNVVKLKSGLIYQISDLMRESFDRREYLATFSDELLIKSRRIDLLIAHTGTVGSYRENLLRSLLKQILPRQYEASTGFIEGCPRQIDILIWDSGNYAPLFRDESVIVVPRDSVRAVIEVKTKLDTATLDEAMEIIWDIFRKESSVAPIFKGIFAYEPGYKSDLAVAKRMQEFYEGKAPDGIIEHEHWYLYAGVTAVCVPKYLLVRERYKVDEDDASTFPQPVLAGATSQWPGDTKMPLFLGLLLAHLDLPAAPKAAVANLFDPILSQMENVDLLTVYPKGWRPRTAKNSMGATLTPEGARLYVERVRHFFKGELSSDLIEKDLGWQGQSPVRTDVAEVVASEPSGAGQDVPPSST